MTGILNKRNLKIFIEFQICVAPLDFSQLRLVPYISISEMNRYSYVKRMQRLLKFDYLFTLGRTTR